MTAEKQKIKQVKKKNKNKVKNWQCKDHKNANSIPAYLYGIGMLEICSKCWEKYRNKYVKIFLENKKNIINKIGSGDK